jgi:hypothetical protein
MMTARPEAVAAGMRMTFAVAAVLIVAAVATAMASRASSAGAPSPRYCGSRGTMPLS